MKEQKEPADGKQQSAKKRWLTFGATAAIFVIVLFSVAVGIQGIAASKKLLKVIAINYEDSSITFQTENGDTRLYISDSKKKTWEEIPTEFIANTVTIDMSWISANSNYELTFKGNVSTDIGSVIIPKQATNLKVSYRASSTNPVAFTNAGNRTIQWRKNNTSVWREWNKNTTNQDLGYLIVNGATLYFRLAPENGISESEPGLRPSKEVAVKIPAKSAAPSISLNASNFTIPLKSGMEYQLVTMDEDGNITGEQGWNPIKSTKSYRLSELAPEALYSGTTLAAAGKTTKKISIQFKTKATSSAQESKITTITIPAQEKAPDLGTIGASISYTSSSSLELSIKAASEKTPYEYSIVKKENVEDEPDYTNMSWTTLTSSNAVSLSKTQAPEGSQIYIRKKTVQSLGHEDFALASDAVKVTSSGGVAYPDGVAINTVTTLIAPAGTIHSGNYGTTKEFKIYSYTKTTVASITFLNMYGNTIGTAECTSTVAKNTGADAGAENAYIITTKITSTSVLDKLSSALNEKLYAKLVLANGEEIYSSDLAGIILYLYPSSKVNNPSVYDKTSYGEYYDTYLTSFDRIYQSKESDDDTYFKFILELGTQYVMDSNQVDQATATKTKLDKITYDAHTLNLKEYTCNAGEKIDDAEKRTYQSNKADALVYYEDYVNNDGEAARRAYVTIHADQFENSSSIKTTNTKLPFIISINNGEVLTDQVYMTLAETATLDSAPIAWTITEGSLTESTTKNSYDEDGNIISTITTPVNTYKLTLTKAEADYSVSVSDVVWGDQSVLYEASVTGNTITITLSNVKINQLKADANGVGKSTSTNNVVIKLSNGFEISTGCKLTILKSASNGN